MVTGSPPDFAAQRLDLRPKAPASERILQRDAQLFEIDGLADEIVGAQPHAAFTSSSWGSAVIIMMLRVSPACFSFSRTSIPLISGR